MWEAAFLECLLRASSCHLSNKPHKWVLLGPCYRQEIKAQKGYEKRQGHADLSSWEESPGLPGPGASTLSTMPHCSMFSSLCTSATQPLRWFLTKLAQNTTLKFKNVVSSLSLPLGSSFYLTPILLLVIYTRTPIWGTNDHWVGLGESQVGFPGPRNIAISP